MVYFEIKDYRELFLNDCIIAYASRRVKPTRGDVERHVRQMLRETNRKPTERLVRDLAKDVLRRVKQ